MLGGNGYGSFAAPFHLCSEAFDNLKHPKHVLNEGYIRYNRGVGRKKRGGENRSGCILGSPHRNLPFQALTPLNFKNFHRSQYSLKRASYQPASLALSLYTKHHDREK